MIVKVEITYSYWDGSGHRKTIFVKKGNSVYQFLCKVKTLLLFIMLLIFICKNEWSIISYLAKTYIFMSVTRRLDKKIYFNFSTLLYLLYIHLSNLRLKINIETFAIHSLKMFLKDPLEDSGKYTGFHVCFHFPFSLEGSPYWNISCKTTFICYNLLIYIDE